MSFDSRIYRHPNGTEGSVRFLLTRHGMEVLQ